MNTISPSQLKEKLKNQDNIFLCDVREPFEYHESHIPGSINIPLRKLSQQITLIPPEKIIITICAHGVRSLRAQQFLAEHGYTAFSMAGGMEMWVEKSGR